MINLYPLALRLWHWLNALMFVFLIVTGISMHYSGSGSLLMPFDLAVTLHDISGISLLILYLAFFIYNLISGNYKNYLPETNQAFKKLMLQAKYYLSGIFKNEPHPFEVTKESKFNPLQRITYFMIMYFMTPIVIITGVFMLFPAQAPDKVNDMSGITIMALLHATSGFFLSIFMIGHIYLATTGEKVTSNFKAMITGWHEKANH